MYDPIFLYNDEVEGKQVTVKFIPDFRKPVAYFSEKERYYSNFNRYMVKEQMVVVPQITRWFMTEDETETQYELLVSNATTKIETKIDAEFDKELNKLLKRLRKQYKYNLKKQLRVYYYCKNTNKLEIVQSTQIANYYYSLNRKNKCAIDQEFNFPEEDCFIIGKIKKTVGTANGELLDFIEPVYRINLKDEELEESQIAEILTGLLAVTIITGKSILKEVAADYIREKKKNNAGIGNINDKGCFTIFKNEILKNFKTGNIKELKELYDVVYS